MRNVVPNCPEELTTEVLLRWQEGRLGAGLAQRVAKHLETCQACERYLDLRQQDGRYQQDGERLRRFDPPPMQAAVWEGVQGRIHPARPNNRNRVVIASASAVLAVVAVIALFATLLSGNVGKSNPITVVPTQGHPTPHPTATVGITPTVDQPWTNVPALSYGKSIAFASLDPMTGYVCGSNAVQRSNVPLQVSVTLDGGQTWGQPIKTTILDAACTLYVNPNNTQDVVMLTGACWRGCSPGPVTLYRSLDGGHTWRHFALPDGSQPSRPTWTDNAMFVYVVPLSAVTPQPRGAHTIAVSVNADPLTWTKDASVFAGIADTTVTVTNAYALGTIYYVELGGSTTQRYPYQYTKDDGATWFPFTPGDGLVTVDVQGVAADRQTLIGINHANQQYLLSTDGGIGWVALLAPSGTNAILSTPDGTYVFAALSANGLVTLEQGMANGTTWKPLALLDPTANPILTWATLAWDANGHLTQLWATEASPPSHTGYTPGIARHAP